MKPFRVYPPEELEKLSMEVYGCSHGSPSKAAAETIMTWISTRHMTPQVAVLEEPVKAARGLLHHVKKNDVELQHEAGERVQKE
jgi:hypothetical protein